MMAVLTTYVKQKDYSSNVTKRGDNYKQNGSSEVYT